MAMPLIRAHSFPVGVVGRLAASFAVIIAGPVYRMEGECGRSTLTRRSPSLRPDSGRRPPIIATLPRVARRNRPGDSRTTSRADDTALMTSRGSPGTHVDNAHRRDVS